MIKVKRVDDNWDLAINVKTDWEDLEQGEYRFRAFGKCAEENAEDFVNCLGKVVSGAFMDKLKECLDKK